MKYKWMFASHIGVALISGALSAYTTHKTTENNVELERLKMKSEQLSAERSHFIQRCEEMSSLYNSMTLGMQTLYSDGGSSDIGPTLEKFARLRSEVQYAESFFGENARRVRDRMLEYVENDESRGPEEKLVPFIVGLEEELKSCNGPNSFPKTEPDA